MAEFLNYTVDLFLKDGTKRTGIISTVDPNQVTLIKSANDKDSAVVISSSSISDLKVVKLPQDFGKSKKQKAAKKKEVKEEPAPAKTETFGATNVKDDFDFAANLAMFDKKSVFADFQKRDTVNPKDRLVGHNKIENVNKNKEEKYRNDEMVLDANRTDAWDSLGSISRKQSLKPIPTTGRSTPNLDDKRNFTLAETGTKKSIPLCSPVQLLEVERIAEQSFGISQSISAEIFATNLSGFITSKILGGSSRLSKNNHNLPPLVLLLIGSERCSIRAYALGRHLANHGVRVLAYVINGETQDSNLRQQQDLFTKSGGKVLSTSVEQLVKLVNEDLDTPVELIVDALQGYDEHLDDIFYETEELQSVKELVAWCNERHQQRKVMSLDIPSGIDGGSGTANDMSLVINSRWCVSMGLPIAGITYAYRNGLISLDDEMHCVLVDVGMPNDVFHHKANLRKFDGIWYSSESIISIQVIQDN